MDVDAPHLDMSTDNAHGYHEVWTNPKDYSDNEAEPDTPIRNDIDHLPSLDGMRVVRYDVKVLAHPMMCTIENVVQFQPGNFPEDTQLEKETQKMDLDQGSGDHRGQEAKFVYPLHGNARMCKFVAKIIPMESGITEEQKRNRTITIEAKIEERKVAREKFEQARAENKEAVLTTLDDRARDCFVCEIGSIPAEHEVVCQFAYFMELDEEGKTNARAGNTGKTVRLLIPMRWKGRYTPAGEKDPIMSTMKNNDSSMMRNMAIHTQGSVSGRRQDGTQWKVTQEGDRWTLDNDQLNSDVQDIELYIQSRSYTTIKRKKEELCEFIAAFEHNPTDKSAILGLKLRPIEKEDYEEVEEIDREYVMVVDRSGSMGGSDMDRARKALIMLLQQLPGGERTKFNVVSFGSRHKFMFNESVDYTDDNVQMALNEVEGFRANFGGTEIMSPLKEIFKKKSKIVRDVILLTDGSVSNTTGVIDLCRENRKKNRVFTVGIGDGVSTALIEGVSEATDAQKIYIKTEDRMTTKIMQLLDYTMKPMLHLVKFQFPQLPAGYTIEGLGMDAEDKEAIYDPKWLYYKINNINTKKFNHLEGKEMQIEMKFDQGGTEFSIAPSVRMDLTMTNGLYAYWAAQQIKRLNKSYYYYGVKEQIVELSKKANILTASTAFLGIRSDQDVPKATNTALEAATYERKLLERRKKAPPLPFSMQAGSANPFNRKAGSTMGSRMALSAPIKAARKSAPATGGVRYCDDDEEDEYSSSDDSSADDNKAGLPATKEVSVDPANVHEALVKISSIKGVWTDKRDLWSCLKHYDSKLTQAAVTQLAGNMALDCFLTVVVLFLLDRFSQDVQIEWKRKAIQSRKFLKDKKVSNDDQNRIHESIEKLLA